MGTNQRNITIYTPGKIYSGYIDTPNETLRTIDIFNAANIYWKDPAEKSFEDALLLNKATIMLEGNTRLCELNRVQVRLRDILFFYDALDWHGDAREKTRAATLKAKSREDTSVVHIITHTCGDSFFYITGTFYGLFKMKSKQRYIPLTQPTVTEVLRTGDSWRKKKIPVIGSFVGVSTKHIEACTFKDTSSAT